MVASILFQHVLACERNYFTTLHSILLLVRESCDLVAFDHVLSIGKLDLEQGSWSVANSCYDFALLVHLPAEPVGVRVIWEVPHHAKTTSEEDAVIVGALTVGELHGCLRHVSCLLVLPKQFVALIFHIQRGRVDRSFTSLDRRPGYLAASSFKLVVWVSSFWQIPADLGASIPELIVTGQHNEHALFSALSESTSLSYFTSRSDSSVICGSATGSHL